MSKRLQHIFLLVLVSVTAQAQDSLRSKPKEIFIGAGSTQYFGDLENDSRGRSLIFVGGIKMNTAKKLNGNFNLSVGHVSGEELDYVFRGDSSANPNSFFKTFLIGLNFDLQYNIVDKSRFKVYLSQGIGAIRYEPRDEFDNTLEDQVDTRAINETYRNITLMLPSMIGAKYILNNGYGVALQAGLYNTTTDYLDNISDWGNKSGGDNIFTIRWQVSVPLK